MCYHRRMWTFVQRTGELLRDGAHVATGYSGLGVGKNNPDEQKVHDVGPLPRGGWRIGPPCDKLGGFALTLVPLYGTPTFGRSGFLIHGDSIEHPGAASHGCLIFPRAIRELIAASGDRNLVVVADAPAVNVV